MSCRIEGLLVDTGIPIKNFPKQIEFVFITHSHGDHWRNPIIKHCLKNDIPVYTHKGCKVLKGNSNHVRVLGEDRKKLIYVEDEFIFEGLLERYHIKLHPLVHDAPNVGLEITIDYGDRKSRVAYATDTGTLRRFKIEPCDYYFIETNYCDYTMDFVRKHNTNFDRYIRSYSTHCSKQEAAQWFHKHHQGKIPGARFIQMHMSSETYKIKGVETFMEKIMKIVSVTEFDGGMNITLQDGDTGVKFDKKMYNTDYNSDTRERIPSAEKAAKAEEQAQKYFGVSYAELPMMEVGGEITIWMSSDGVLYFEEPSEFEQIEYTPAPGNKVPSAFGLITRAIFGPRGITITFQCTDKHKLPKGPDEKGCLTYRKQFVFSQRNANGDYEISGNVMIKSLDKFNQMIAKSEMEDVPKFGYADVPQTVIDIEQLIGATIHVAGREIPSSKIPFWEVLNVYKED